MDKIEGGSPLLKWERLEDVGGAWSRWEAMAGPYVLAVDLRGDGSYRWTDGSGVRHATVIAAQLEAEQGQRESLGRELASVLAGAKALALVLPVEPRKATPPAPPACTAAASCPAHGAIGIPFAALDPRDGPCGPLGRSHLGAVVATALEGLGAPEAARYARVAGRAVIYLAEALEPHLPEDELLSVVLADVLRRAACRVCRGFCWDDPATSCPGEAPLQARAAEAAAELAERRLLSAEELAEIETGIVTAEQSCECLEDVEGAPCSSCKAQEILDEAPGRLLGHIKGLARLVRKGEP